MDVGAVLEHVRSLVETIGVLGTGAWAAWTFHKLQAVRAAEVDIQGKIAEAKKSDAEKEEIRQRIIGQQPLLDIDIRAKQVGAAGASAPLFLYVIILLKNEGQQNLEVIFDDSALTVARMDLDSQNRPEPTKIYRAGPWWVPPKGAHPQKLEERIFRVGQRRRMAFLVPIPSGGIYFVQFQATYGRAPFEGERTSKQEPLFITAIEQRFVSAVPSNGAA